MGDLVAIIPARSGSKGVPNKNINLISGRPLLAYSIAVARLVKKIERIFVSTDSEYYARIAQKYGAETPFLRPAELSDDRSTDYDVIKHALDWILANEGYQPKYLVYLRPTSPLRDATYIEAAIERINKNDNATSLRSVHEMSETSYKTLEIEGSYLKCICTGAFDIESANQPRQTYPRTYHPNGYVDIVKSSYVIKNKRAFGDKVIALVTPPIVEIDTMDDFSYLEYQIAKEPVTVARLFPEGSNL